MHKIGEDEMEKLRESVSLKSNRYETMEDEVTQKIADNDDPEKIMIVSIDSVQATETRQQRTMIYMLYQLEKQS